MELEKIPELLAILKCQVFTHWEQMQYCVLLHAYANNCPAEIPLASRRRSLKFLDRELRDKFQGETFNILRIFRPIPPPFYPLQIEEASGLPRPYPARPGVRRRGGAVQAAPLPGGGAAEGGGKPACCGVCCPEVQLDRGGQLTAGGWGFRPAGHANN
jgi:hypothetical protein